MQIYLDFTYSEVCTLPLLPFNLVQRLVRSPHPSVPAGPLGSHFDLVWMGNANYEFDTPQVSYKEMADAPLQVVAHELTRGEVTKNVYFVADAAHLDQIWDSFVTWATEDVPPSRERTHFDNEFDERDWLGAPLTDTDWERTHAWWAFDEHIMWTLNEAYAQELLASFGQ